jgi:hypothetical protein
MGLKGVWEVSHMTRPLFSPSSSPGNAGIAIFPFLTLYKPLNDALTPLLTPYRGRHGGQGLRRRRYRRRRTSRRAHAAPSS